MKKFSVLVKGERLQYVPFSQVMEFESEEEYLKWIRMARKESSPLKQEYKDIRGIY